MSFKRDVLNLSSHAVLAIMEAGAWPPKGEAVHRGLKAYLDAQQRKALHLGVATQARPPE